MKSDKMNAWMRSQVGRPASSVNGDDDPAANKFLDMVEQHRKIRQARLRRLLIPKKDHCEE